jgi:hypothetical protein
VHRFKRALLVRIIVCCGALERAEADKERNINIVKMVLGYLLMVDIRPKSRKSMAKCETLDLNCVLGGNARAGGVLRVNSRAR